MKKQVGNEEFRKAFKRHAHQDDWGVYCVYDYSAWRIWKAAIRLERKRLQNKPSESGTGQ